MNELLMMIIVIVTSALITVLPTKHALHVFQQNRYEIPRYNEWLNNYGRKQLGSIIRTIVVMVLFVVIGFLPLSINNRYAAWFVLALVHITFDFILESKKAYIKPLRYTGRVIRQIVVLVILYLITGYLLTRLPRSYHSLFYVAAFCLPWLYIYPMHYLTYPIEKIVQNHYISLAKKILAEHSKLIKIGITGSYGKTSSKNILQAILSEQFYSLMTPASFNTPMGITITIRTLLKPLHEVFICEMGADKVGEIAYLSKFVQPQYGIVTSVGPQHLNTFKSIDNIVNEKMQLIENLPITGVGVLNKDNEYLRNYYLRNKCKIVWYGIEEEDVDYRAINIEYSPEGSTFDVLTRTGASYPFKTRLLGAHNIANILASIALAIELGISWEQLQKAVLKTPYVEHRLEVKKINGYTFIDNAFNSNPVSASISLDVLSGMPGKRVIITPGMIDLGVRQEEVNRQFGRDMLDKVDLVILVGVNQTKPIVAGLNDVNYPKDNIQVFKTVKEAFSYVYKHCETTDTILLENDLPDVFNK